jgi:uncharacterized protein YkwD
MNLGRFPKTAIAGGLLGSLFLLLSAIPQNRPPNATPHTTPPHPVAATATQASSEEQLLFDSANRERAALQLPRLEWDAVLASAARQHAKVMTREHDLSHQYPGEPPLDQRAAQAGARFSSIAENIAFGQDAAEIHDGWMHSPGHRKNILSPDITALGIAVIRKGDNIYAVQDFSRPVPVLSIEQQEQKVIALLSTTGPHPVETTADARKTCATSNGFSGPQPTAIFHFETADLSKLPVELTKAVRNHANRRAAIGACATAETTGFVRFRFAVLLY